MSVFDVLGKDHDEVKRMLAELRQRPADQPTLGASTRELTIRQKRIEELVAVMSRHEAAEEMYFWPAVRERHPDGDVLADKAIAQEEEGGKILDLLGELDAGQPEFEAMLAMFVQAARDHMFYEETIVWPGLALLLSGHEAASLGRKLKRARKNAPARPYPAAPARAGALKEAGRHRRALSCTRKCLLSARRCHGVERNRRGAPGGRRGAGLPARLRA
jgi:hypothetical protein